MPELLKIVRRGSRKDARSAAETLVALREHSVIPALLEMIKDGSRAKYNVGTNLPASRALVGLQAPEIIDALTSMDKSISDDDAAYLLTEPWVVQHLTDVLRSNHDSSRRVGAAFCLGRAQDADAGKVLSELFPVERDANVRQEILYSLCKVKSPKATETLLEALQRYYTDRIRETAASCLSTRSNPAFAGHFLDALEHDSSLRVRTTAVEALTQFRTPRADSAIAKRFTDDDYRIEYVVNALRAYGWVPPSDRQKVYGWITMHDRVLLASEWETTKRILLADVVAGDRKNAEYAIETFIQLGREEIVESLVIALNKHGTKPLAEVYLNCGYEPLKKAAVDWASRHSYSIKAMPGSGKVRWGSMR
jgi:HEAT repeat protein